MRKDRRSFIGQLSVLAAAAAVSSPATSLAHAGKNIFSSRGEVNIFHTNDLGVSSAFADPRRLKELFAKDRRGLLVDAGGFFNIDSPAQAINAMNQAGYLAANVGHHELSAGQDVLASLVPQMQFSLVNCNYRFNGALSRMIKRYVIVYAGNIKIGITGVGEPINGVDYTDAIQSANATASILKNNEKCDLVVCLSYLGYKNDGNQTDNRKLAAQSENIDLIISGNYQTVLSAPVIVLNRHKSEVAVSHAAWGGLMAGKMTFEFNSRGNKNISSGRYYAAGQLQDKKFIDCFTELREQQREQAA